MKNENEKNDISQDQVTDIVKKKRGSKWMRDTSSEGGDLIEPGDNSRYVRFAMASWDLPPIDISDPKQVAERIRQYFQFCVDNDRKPQVIGMANWLGVSRDTINSWKRGEYRNDTHSDVIKKAIDSIEEMWIDFAINGKMNPAAFIFIAKNHMGYKDVQDVVVAPQNPLDNLNAEEARKRLMESIPDEE